MCSCLAKAQLGLAVSLGGGFSPVLGWIADHGGVSASLLTVAGLAAAGTLIASTLPGEARRDAHVAYGAGPAA